MPQWDDQKTFINQLKTLNHFIPFFMKKYNSQEDLKTLVSKCSFKKKVHKKPNYNEKDA